VDPVPGPVLLRKSGSAGNRTQIFGSVARNSDRDLTGDLQCGSRPTNCPQVSQLSPPSCNPVSPDNSIDQRFRFRLLLAAIRGVI
jgi:hypothetical protein